MKINLPTEIPTDLQEKLAWAICDYNLGVIQEAIDAGANPFICHKTEVAQSYFLKNRIEALLDAEELSPYYLLFYTPKYSETKYEDLLNTAETLLKNGVSADKKPSHTFNEFSYTLSFRQQVDQWIKEFETAEQNQKYPLTPEQKNLLSMQINLLKKLLKLMKKYQPETID